MSEAEVEEKTPTTSSAESKQSTSPTLSLQEQETAESTSIQKEQNSITVSNVAPTGESYSTKTIQKASLDTSSKNALRIADAIAPPVVAAHEQASASSMSQLLRGGGESGGGGGGGGSTHSTTQKGGNGSTHAPNVDLASTTTTTTNTKSDISKTSLRIADAIGPSSSTHEQQATVSRTISLTSGDGNKSTQETISSDQPPNVLSAKNTLRMADAVDPSTAVEGTTANNLSNVLTQNAAMEATKKLEHSTQASTMTDTNNNNNQHHSLPESNNSDLVRGSIPAIPIVLHGAVAVQNGQAEQLGKGVLTHIAQPTVPEYVPPPSSSSHHHSRTSRLSNPGNNYSDDDDDDDDGDDYNNNNGNADKDGDNENDIEQSSALETVDADCTDLMRSQNKANASGSGMRHLIIGICCIVIIGAIVAGVVIATADQDNNNNDNNNNNGISPTEAPTTPSESARLIAARDYLVESGISSLDTLTNTTTSQYQALAWIADSDTLLSHVERPTTWITRYALAAFYYATNGPSWLVGNNWLRIGIHECAWSFIACTEESIVSIKVTNAINMIGTIPLELGALSELEELCLQNNDIYDVASPISSLEILNLAGSTIGDHVAGIPSAIFEMTNLVQLNLMGNGILGTLSTEIANLSNLVNLDLSENKFHGTLETHFDTLSSLTDLSFEANDLEGNVATIFQGMTSLKSMKGDFNALTGSLTSIDFLNYQSLQRLELAGNAISGPFPNSIFNISSIALIDVSSNAITGSFGENLGKASSLQQLVVSRNPISGTIPTQIGTLGQLNSLVLEYCQFSGTIPTEIGNCPKLRYAYLGTNNLVGTLPTELGNLSNLETFQVGSNMLTGPIPTTLGRLSSLGNLQLAGNSLTGTLPTEVCEITTLSTISLAEGLSDGVSCGDCPKCT